MTDIFLRWNTYAYLPYERDLAFREVEQLLEPEDVDVTSEGVMCRGCMRPTSAKNLVYFQSYEVFDDGVSAGAAQPTRQHQIEVAATNGARRQPTRYSTHGVHEYKGKFNPQTARALLNLAALEPGEMVLDPYCGSGTTIVEAVQRGYSAVGLDINPLALHISRLKVGVLRTCPKALTAELETVLNRSTRLRKGKSTPRSEYLARWLPPQTLTAFESLFQASEEVSEGSRDILRLLASDLLREYSLQDPSDLRVRRRSSPLPTMPIRDKLRERVASLLEKLISIQKYVHPDSLGRAFFESVDVASSSGLPDFGLLSEVRAVVTSPPYAMALPYIDTQRLSLVWLGLCDPGDLRSLEARLTGSREIGTGERRKFNERIVQNAALLPGPEHEICQTMLDALGEDDGFRRRAVPALLYRYFEQTAEMFASIRSVVAEGVPYFLVVGHNTTTLGGKRFEINTPSHLGSLAAAEGWQLDEVLELQTYQRFGLHAKNAVASESLICLRAK